MQTLGGLRTPPTNTTHKAKNPTKKKKKAKRIFAGNIKRFGLSFVVAPLPFIFSFPFFFRRTKQIAKPTDGKKEKRIYPIEAVAEYAMREMTQEKDNSDVIFPPTGVSWCWWQVSLSSIKGCRRERKKERRELGVMPCSPQEPANRLKQPELIDFFFFLFSPPPHHLLALS